MEEHDCKHCELSGNCAIEDIISWLEEHEAETEKARIDTVEAITKATVVFLTESIVVTHNESSLGSLIKNVYLVAYHKGRTFPAIPAVFQE